MTDVKVKFDDRKLRDGMRRAQQVLDERELLTGIGMKGLNWVNDNFRRGGLEKKWKALSPNTIAARRGSTAQILRDTGRLSQSFVYKLRGGSVWLGTNNKIAPFHHEGTEPYTIKPGSGKSFLRFQTAGGVRFARTIKHPGLPSRPLIPSNKLAGKIAVDFIEGALERL